MKRMNKFEAKNYLNELATDENKEKNFYRCMHCPLDGDRFPIEQTDVGIFLHSYKLYNTSICSSKFLYICLKYKPKQIQNIIDYAKKITRDKNVLLKYCPCGSLSDLSKYVLSKEWLLDIE